MEQVMLHSNSSPKVSLGGGVGHKSALKLQNSQAKVGAEKRVVINII
jgi:hypothetical protein